MQEPKKIVLKETTTQRLCGRKRKVVVNKTEMMYVPILDTLQAQLNNATVIHEVCLSTRKCERIWDKGPFCAICKQ